MKLDEEVKVVSKDSIAMVAKSTEYFLEFVCKKVAYQMALRGARTVQDSDIIAAIHQTEEMTFMRSDFPRKAKVIRKPLSSHSNKEKENRGNEVVEKTADGSGQIDEANGMDGEPTVSPAKTSNEGNILLFFSKVNRQQVADHAFDQIENPLTKRKRNEEETIVVEEKNMKSSGRIVYKERSKLIDLESSLVCEDW